MRAHNSVRLECFPYKEEVASSNLAVPTKNPMDGDKIPFKQWVIIRHIRWVYLSWSFGHWWDKVGRHLGAFPNEADIKFLDDVWEGKS